MTGRIAIGRTYETHVVLNVRVTPKSGTEAINGLYEAADGTVSLKVRVTQPPDKGKANKAVIALLAKRLGFAKSALSIVAGDTSRNKQIRISGQPDIIARALDGIVQFRDGD